MREYYNRHNRLASACRWSNLSSVFRPSTKWKIGIRESDYLATRETASYILFSAKTQTYKQNTYRKWSWKIFVSIKFTSSYLALKLGYMNKTHAHIHKVELKILNFNFVWLLQNCFLRSISGKWKTIEVSTFHAPLVR